MTLDIPNSTDEILTSDAHLIQSFADLHGLKQQDARTAIVGAKGAYVTDSEGNDLIDGIGGLWCVNVGHGRTEIIDAITEQLKTLDYYSTFYNFTHPSAAELAKKVTSLAPNGLNHGYFANSGSVANDTAVRATSLQQSQGTPEQKETSVAYGRVSRFDTYGDGANNPVVFPRVGHSRRRTGAPFAISLPIP